MNAVNYHDAELIKAYRKWRGLQPDFPASMALSYARADLEQRAVLARFGSWTFADGGYGSFAYADYEAWSCGDIANASLDDPTEEEIENGLDGKPYAVRVLVGNDDHGVEWGDTEPTDAERENATAYYVALIVEDHEGAEILHDSIHGVDVIDLDGYLQRDWKDAVAYALIEYLDVERAVRIATTEASERAYWAARSVETVD